MQSTGYYSNQYMVQPASNSLLPGIMRPQPQQQQQQQQLPQLGQVIMDNGQLDTNEDLEDDDDEDEKKPAKRSGRRKIKIEYIEDKTRRHITFSKRKAGIMKKVNRKKKKKKTDYLFRHTN
jgi:hypothetical protein